MLYVTWTRGGYVSNLTHELQKGEKEIKSELEEEMDITWKQGTRGPVGPRRVYRDV